jgi:hypothetical protein
MEKLIQKENGIFEILQKFIEAGLEFILVGGYAVSSYKHRFSVDADIVIQIKDLEKFEKHLKKEGFRQTISKELENIYSSRFVRFEKEEASVDILIDALASRQTNAAFSYDLLLKNSSKRKVIGIEKEVNAFVPSREMLIATKVHSGRLTDFRDIAALAKDSNLELVKKLLFIGDLSKLQKNLDELNRAVNDSKFEDSFKGVFMEKKFDVDFDKVRKISELKSI